MNLIREFLAGSGFLLFPQIALVLFFSIFLVVLARLLTGGRGGSPEAARLAQLPLERDGEDLRDE